MSAAIFWVLAAASHTLTNQEEKYFMTRDELREAAQAVAFDWPSDEQAAACLERLVRHMLVRQCLASAALCAAKVDLHRETRLSNESRAAETEEDELRRLRAWSDTRLWNAAHEQMAKAIEAQAAAL